MPPRPRSFPFLALLALLTAMASISVGTSFAKRLFPAVGAAGTTAYRVTFGTIILLSIWRPWRAAIRTTLTRAALITIARWGVTLGLMNLLFYMSLRTVHFGVAVAIEFLGPLTVAVLSSRRAIDFVWILFTVLGLLLLLPLGANAIHLDPTGVGFALGAAICWGLYIVFGQRAGKLHGGTATSLGMTAAMIVVLPFGVAQAGRALFDPSLLLAGIGVGVLSSAVPYSLELIALSRLPRRTFSILLSMEPAMSALAAFVVLGERLTLLQWLAVGSVIVASIGSAATASTRPMEERDVPPPVID